MSDIEKVLSVAAIALIATAIFKAVCRDDDECEDSLHKLTGTTRLF